MKNLSLYLLTAAAALSSAPAFAQSTNYVKNGGFDAATPSASSTTNNGNFELTTNNQYGTVANWTTTGGYNLLFNTSNASGPSGNAYGDYTSTGKEYLSASPVGMSGNFLALDGDSSFARPVYQAITGLVVGQTYNLAFDWMANQIASRTGSVTDGIYAAIGGNVFTTPALGAPSGAQHASYTFTYTGGDASGNVKYGNLTAAANILGFMSYGSPSGQPPVALLDNVSISAVPEPATWAMMIVGIGIVGGAMRLRRRKTGAAIASLV